MTDTSRRLPAISGLLGSVLLAAVAMLPTAASALPATSGSLWFYSPSHRSPFGSVGNGSPAAPAMADAPRRTRDDRGSHSLDRLRSLHPA